MNRTRNNRGEMYRLTEIGGVESRLLLHKCCQFVCGIRNLVMVWYQKLNAIIIYILLVLLIDGVFILVLTVNGYMKLVSEFSCLARRILNPPYDQQ